VTDAVWVVTRVKKNDKGEYKLAKLDIRNNRMQIEEKAHSGAKVWMGSPLAVDKRGHPAYVNSEKAVHWRRNGKWEHPMPEPGCAFTVAFGGNGSFYARDCKYSYVHNLRRSKKWLVFPTSKQLDYAGLRHRNKKAIASTKGLQKFIDIAADSRGTLWGVTMSNTVIYWNKGKKKWYKAGFPNYAVSVAAGPSGHVYVLGYP